LPEGDAIIVIWMKLLCLAGNINDSGMVYFTKEIPYTDQMLAMQFNRPLTTVQLALKVFEQFGMIEVIENILHISNWEKYQSVDRLNEIREYNRIAKRKSREKQRALMESNVCQYCGDVATGYDHIIPKSKGGSDKDENKIPCCKICNSIKKDNPVSDFLNSNLERINIGLINSNHKLSKFVKFNGKYFDNVNDSQGHCQRCHDTDIDKDIDKEKEIYISIVDYLNEKAGTNYKTTSKKTQSCIHARLAEGFTIDDFKTVIEKKCAEWMGTEWEKFIRPETLFGTKFESYLNAKVTKKQQPVNTGMAVGVDDPLEGLF
jgi:uncharacterized phage protein (TIGR02220 family)/predicted phage replisome organizer